MYLHHQLSINREMVSAIGTMAASFIALLGYWFAWYQEKERRKFETKLKYYDENTLKSIIPIKPLDKRKFLEQEGDEQLLKIWYEFDLLLRIESINNGLTRKHSGIIVYKNPTNNMKNTPSHRDYIISCLKPTGDLVKQNTTKQPIRILEEYPSKVHCIEQALKICNAEIIY